jgi:ABC-type glycerol-3-phosphate transport system permease component
MTAGSRGAARWLQALATAGLILAIAFPLYWTVLSSLMPERQLTEPARLIPAALTDDHYRRLFTERDFWTPIQSSLVVAGTTTLFCVALGSLCAYALARLEFAGRTVVLAFILAVSMFPQITIVSPLYALLRAFGLIDTYPGLVLPYLTFAMPLTVWLLVGFFQALPRELEEAAMVDGASRVTTFARIILPLALPGLATTGIITFIYCWNEFLFALSFTVSPARRTVPVAIALFRGQYQVPWGQILAATVVATAPVALLVLAFQRRIVRGLTAGAVKG